MGTQVAATDVWTATSLVLIAIGAVLAFLVIWWGARLKRQRKATDAAIEDSVDERADEAPMAAPLAAASMDDIAPAAPETEPVAAEPTPPPTPVAPAPPPLADTPVVATPAPRVDPAPAGADELTTLKGVGPKLAARLNELGITRFAQVAALTPDEASALDAQLGSFQGRMARDRWIEQAGYLAKGDRAGFEAAFGRL